MPEARIFDRFTVWSFNGKEWKRRKDLTADQINNENRADLMQPFEEKHKQPAAIFPKGINPNNETLLGFMQRKIETSLVNYKTDFYHHDSFMFFEFNRRAIWILREHGTTLLPLEYNNKNPWSGSADHAGALQIFEYRQHESSKSSKPQTVYILKDGDAQKVTFEKAAQILKAAAPEEKQKAI